MNKSIDFFARQFDHQIDASEYALNLFEQRSLAYLQGDVLDLGCGLDNLSSTVVNSRRLGAVACPLGRSAASPSRQDADESSAPSP